MAGGIQGGRTLMVYLAADTANFKRNMNQADASAKGFGSKVSGLGSTMKNMLGPALIGAGLAAGAMAIKLGVDGVKAAVEDEAAVAKLATTMDNLGLANDKTAVEKNIGALETQLGIVDMELRPAFDRLVRSIGNTAGATKTLTLAASIAAGTGKSLDAVVQALGRAYDGSTTGLSRLGAGLDAATLATGDMEVITAKLTKTFGGQATIAAQTYEGQIKRLGLEVDNLKESFGRGILMAISDTNEKTDQLLITMKELEPVMQDIGGTFGDFASNVGTAVIGVASLKTAFDDFMGQDTAIITTIIGIGNELTKFIAGPALIAARALLLLGNSVTASGAADSRAGQGYVPMRQPAAPGGGPRMGGGNSGQWANFYTVNASGTKAWAEANLKLNQGLLDLNPNLAKLTGGGGASKDAFISVKDAMAAASEQINIQFAPALQLAQSALDAVQQKAVEYADSIRSAITGTISLSQAWSDAVSAGSMNKGVDALAGLQAQLKDTKTFSEAFKGLADNPDVNQLLADQLLSVMQTQGPVAGTELINAMTPAIAQQLSADLQALEVFAGETGVAMSKKFYDQGTEDAVAMLNGISAEIAAQQKSLKQLGQNIGEPIAGEITKQIQRAIRQGLIAGQAEADRQQAAAFALSASTRVTQTAVGQGITAVVRQTDQRTGSLPAAALR